MLSKSIYSEEELEQLFQNLFLEKKKVKELEQKLQVLHQEHQSMLSDPQDTLSQSSRQKEQIGKLAITLRDREKKIRELQQFEHSYKKNNEHKQYFETKYEKERIVNDSLRVENQELSKTLAETQKHSEQLKLALKHIQERSQEAYLELNQLREDFQRSQEAVSNLTEQLHLAQNRLHEQTHNINTFQIEKEESLSEMQALQSQFAVLKSKVFEGQEALQLMNQEKMQLDGLLSEKTHLFDKLVDEVTLIKQSLFKGMTETKDIEKLYLGVVNEKTTLYNKVTQLEQVLERQHIEIKNLQEKLEETEKKEAAFKIQHEQHNLLLQEQHQTSLHELQKNVKDLELNLHKHHSLLQEKEREIENNHTQILGLTQEKLKLEDSLSNVTRYQDEQDARIKVAHQHLGKKVKEVAFLNEKIEEQNTQILDFQMSLNQLKNKIIETQTSYEQQMQQEKKHQEQLHETVKFAEGQVVKWEEKYLKTYEKLKILEEKQQQMQGLFASIGNVMGTQHASQATPVLATALVPKIHQSPKKTLQLVDTQNIQPQNHEEIHKQEEKVFNPIPIQGSLFDVEQPRVKVRQNLFD